MRPVILVSRWLKQMVLPAVLLFGLSMVSVGCAAETGLQVDASLMATSDTRPTASPTPSATASITPKPTDTKTPTVMPTPTQVPTQTPTATLTPLPTQIPTATSTPTLIAPTQIVPTARIPILMYHHVAIAPPGSDSVRVDLSVPPDVFGAEIKFLHDQGFHTVHLTDVVNNLQNQTPLPAKPMVITFDDGYDDNYLNAFPTLKDFGFVGTFFIISNRPDESAGGYATWPQIEEMAANGMEIGSHSLDHRYNLGQVPASIQWAEIKPSYNSILEHLPGQAPVFAYPSGSYNSTTIGFLRQLGYVAAVTTIQGVTQRADAPLELRRVRIRGEWSISEFAYWLSYWLGGL